MLPLGTSAVTVGFGFLVALDRWPVDLRAKTILVPIAQAVVAIPFVIRAVVPALRSIDPRLARRRERARRAAAAGVARGRPADHDAGVRGRRSGSRSRCRSGEFGATLVRRAARRADDPDRDLAVPVAARRAERRAGDGDVDDPDGRDRRGRARDRAGARAPARRVLMLAVERRGRALRREHGRRRGRPRRRRRRDRRDPRAERLREDDAAARGRRACSRSTPGRITGTATTSRACRRTGAGSA